MNIKEEILGLERKIRDLTLRMPAHSVSVEMMQELEGLEDGLARKKKGLNSGK